MTDAVIYKEFIDPEYFRIVSVKRVGNGASASVPKKYLGRKVFVIVERV